MSWSQTAVDVAFDDVLGAALIAGAPLGRNDQSNAKRIGKALPIKGVNAPISKHVTPSSKHMWAKRHPGVAQKNGQAAHPLAADGRASAFDLAESRRADAAGAGPDVEGKVCMEAA